MTVNKTSVYKLLQGDVFLFISTTLEYVCLCADDLCTLPHRLMALNKRTTRYSDNACRARTRFFQRMRVKEHQSSDSRVPHQGLPTTVSGCARR